MAAKKLSPMVIALLLPLLAGGGWMTYVGARTIGPWKTELDRVNREITARHGSPSSSLEARRDTAEQKFHRAALMLAGGVLALGAALIVRTRAVAAANPPAAGAQFMGRYTPGQWIGGGVVNLILAAVAYWQLSEFETTHASFRTLKIVVVAYQHGGKWGAVGLFAGVGLLLVVIGIHVAQQRQAREWAQLEDAADEPLEPRRYAA